MFGEGPVFGLVGKFTCSSLLPDGLGCFCGFKSLLTLLLLVRVVSKFFLTSCCITSVGLTFSSVRCVVERMPCKCVMECVRTGNTTFFFVFMCVRVTETLLCNSCACREVNA